MVERRATMSIDPERFGELSATVKSLEKHMTEGFERLEKVFESNKAAHDVQAAKDYKYLDNKIDEVKADVKPLIDAHMLKNKGFLSTVKAKAGELMLSSAIIFVIGWMGWSFLSYLEVIK